MSVGRVLGAGLASLAVAGCAVVALGMNSAAKREPSGATHRAALDGSAGLAGLSRATKPAVLPMHTASGAFERAGAGPTVSVTVSAAPSSSAAAAAAAPTGTRPAAPASLSATVAGSVHPAAPRSTAAPHPSSAARSTASPRPAGTTVAAAPRGVALPLRFRTGTATRVITVTAHSYGSTTATLQAWTKVAAGGWQRYGSSVTAHVGADGLSTQPSETRSATPIGSFTLTQAFGHLANPGTALPYIHTRPSDWWISQSGPLYNTHQRCSSGCAFRLGSPNEHLYYETPYYNYAVVIDYNTRNAPGGVRQGAGSAFFLHVTDGNPTAGCVAIPQAKLVTLIRWLRPGAHPRILIGVR